MSVLVTTPERFVIVYHSSGSNDGAQVAGFRGRTILLTADTSERLEFSSVEAARAEMAVRSLDRRFRVARVRPTVALSEAEKSAVAARRAARNAERKLS